MKKLTRMAAAALVLAAPGSAMAVCDQCVTGAIQSLSQTVQQGFSNVVSAIESQTKADAKINAKFHDANAKITATSIQMQEAARLSYIYEGSPSDCNAAQIADVAWDSDHEMATARSILSQQLLDAKMNPERANHDRLQAWADARQKYAPNGPMPYADVDARSLTHGAGQAGKGRDSTFSAAQMEAAARYIDNALVLQTPAPLPGAKGQTLEGQRYEVMRREYMARSSPAQKIFVDVAALRAPSRTLNGESQLALLEKQVNARYGNAEWLEQIHGKDLKPLMVEQLYMQALELRLRMLEIEKLENIEIGIAQLVSLGAYSPEMLRELEEQRQRALGSGR